VKRLLAIAGICVLAVSALVQVQCESLVGGMPTNVKIEALTDTSVKITWSAPTEGTPDKYTVNFMEVGAASYSQLAEVTTTMYEHSPNGATGSYKVTAVFSSNTYDGAIVKSAPVSTAATTVAELNASGNSGYGWSMSSGAGATYSMDEAANAPNVDFYITDFATGFAGSPYNIASPDLALSTPDPGAAGVVEPGAWRVNAFADRVTDPQAALPKYVQGQSYYGYTALDVDPAFVPGYLKTEGYYALVKISGRNQGAGTVQVETWFQLVKGLRLIKH